MPKLAWAFIAAAVLLWGTVVTSVWAPVNWHLLLIAGPGGGASLVLAGVICLRDRLPEERDADADKDALAYALRDVTLRRGLARTRPLKRVA